MSITTILIFCILLIAGCLSAFAREASKYILKFKFSPSYWWSENGHPFIASVIVSNFIFWLVVAVPDLSDSLSNYIGLTIPPIDSGKINLAPLLLGATVASWVYEYFNKSSKLENEKQNDTITTS